MNSASERYVILVSSGFRQWFTMYAYKTEMIWDMFVGWWVEVIKHAIKCEVLKVKQSRKGYWILKFEQVNRDGGQTILGKLSGITSYEGPIVSGSKWLSVFPHKACTAKPTWGWSLKKRLTFAIRLLTLSNNWIKKGKLYMRLYKKQGSFHYGSQWPCTCQETSLNAGRLVIKGIVSLDDFFWSLSNKKLQWSNSRCYNPYSSPHKCGMVLWGKEDDEEKDWHQQIKALITLFSLWYLVISHTSVFIGLRWFDIYQ